MKMESKKKYLGYKPGKKAAMGLLTIILGILFIAVPEGWCSGKSQAAQPVSGIRTITVTDVAGRQVTIPLPVKKVNVNTSGSGGAFLTMSALLGTEVADYLSSWDAGLPNNRFDMYDHYRSKIPALEQVPLVGGVGSDDFNMEKLIQLKPDVVIWSLGSRNQAKAIAEPAFEAAGIPLVYIDYHAETLENHTLSIRLLGKIFEKEALAEEMIAFYTDNMTMINERLTKAQTKPVVYMEVTSKGPEVYDNTYGNYMWGQMVVKAGGTNMAEGIVSTYAPISAELLLSKNPDYIILTGSYWPNNPTSVRMGYLSNEAETQRLLRTYLNRPGWSELQAVKNGRIFAIHHGISREIYDVAAVAFLAKCIHPELFEDIDPLGMLKDYYDRFLPYDLSGVWMTKLQ